MEPGLDRARGDLDAPGDAGGRGDEEPEALGRHAALVGDELHHPLVGKRPTFQHQHRGVAGLRVADSLVELSLDPSHAAGRSRAHGEVPRRVDGPAGILAGHARRHRMIGGDFHGGEPEATQVDAREGYRGQTGETDLGQPPARLEPSWRQDAAVEHPGAAHLRDRDTEEGRVGRERVGESRGAAVQAEVQAHGASRHDAPRFRAGLTSTHASRPPNALRSTSARSRAAGSPRTSAKTVGPQELCPTP